MNTMELDDDTEMQESYCAENTEYIEQDEDEVYDFDTSDAEKNLRELNELYNEATQMLINGIKPTEGWYDDHFKYIYKYSQLNWRDMAERFRNKDNIVFSLATTITLYIDELMEEYGGKPDFDFNKYYTVLCNIVNIWNYYSEKYIGDETDKDVLDLIEGLTFL